MKRMKQLVKEYQEVEIPEEIQKVVKHALYPYKKRKLKKIYLGIAVAAALFITSVNTSSTIAYAFSDVPVLGKVVNLITFREFKVDEGTYKADYTSPEVNLENKELANSLNEKYLKENEQLYQGFLTDMKELKKNGGGHLSEESGFEIKTDNKRIFSIGRYYVNNVGSSSTTMKFDTVDKERQILITLPSLFKNKDYVNVISENIKEQMRAQMKADPEVTYWVSGTGEKSFDPFKKIVKEQNFYINNQGKLVISFDKYEVSPGYMGVVEFIIPTEVIQDQLVSNEYLK